VSRKLELFLAPGPSYTAPDQIGELVAVLATTLAEAGTVRVVAHDPGILGGLAHGEETAAAPAFVGLVEVAFADGSDTDAGLAALGAALGAAPAFDRSASTAVAGSEYVIVEGDEPLMLAMALRRRPELTRAEFHAYWLTHHAELGRQVPGSEGYRQVHRDETLSERAAAALGLGGPEFDGVAVAYYSSGDRFLAIMANTEIVEGLLEDERRFIDHSQAALVVGRAPGLPTGSEPRAGY
jgi:EthD domain